MKTLNTIILALGATALLGTTGLYAQTKAAVANIPFDFTVQNVTMPAGEYTWTALHGQGGQIEIRNDQTGVSALVLAPRALATYQSKDTSMGKIIFHRYGDRYFFSEVWTPSDFCGRTLPSKLERELQASRAETQMASVSIPLTSGQ
jgi:hypothetical protein